MILEPFTFIKNLGFCIHEKQRIMRINISQIIIYIFAKKGGGILCSIE